MDVVALPSAAAFAEAAFPYLEAHEAEHNLLLGVTSRLIEGGRGGWAPAEAPPGFWLVHEKGDPVGAALMTPPYDLVVSRCRQGAPTTLASWLADHDVGLPGVTSGREASDEFASAWESLTATRFEIWRKERIYELVEVTAPGHVGGRSRPAGIDDLPLLTDWLQAFADFVGEPMDAGAAAADAVARARALLWVDPEPVSLAVWSRLTRAGASVGPVYTPPEWRGRGYASAVTATLSARLLDSGRSFCCLYTDLDNPTSNRIYQRIGYRPVVDVNHYRFVES